MKTISLQEFAKQVKILADKKKAVSYTVEVQLSFYLDTPRWKFSCYVSGYSFHTADTPFEALTKLKAQMFPKKSNIKDVLVEDAV